jgi:hypothetical protein
MAKLRLGANFAVFLLFFGVAALEAFQTQNWIRAAFWLAIGLVFLLADNLKKSADHHPRDQGNSDDPHE